MQALSVSKPNSPAQLYDELIDAIPSLAPVPGEGGRNVSVLSLVANGNEISIVFPEGVPVSDVSAVVAAHKPGEET